MSTLNTTKKPAEQAPLQDWHRADIKAALEKAGWSLRQLSITHGYTLGALKNALSVPWPLAEKLIAEAIGVPRTIVWPSRYHADGRPKSGRRERGIGRRKSSVARNSESITAKVACNVSMGAEI